MWQESFSTFLQCLLSNLEMKNPLETKTEAKKQKTIFYPFSVPVGTPLILFLNIRELHFL
jgi:hypothetical protein